MAFTFLLILGPWRAWDSMFVRPLMELFVFVCFFSSLFVLSFKVGMVNSFAIDNVDIRMTHLQLQMIVFSL